MSNLLQTSVLCQNVHELEKDFKYNLYILKVKEAEIRRLTSQQANFETQRSQWTREQQLLRTNIKNLEQTLSAIKEEKSKLTQLYETKFADLSRTLEKTKQDADKHQHDLELRTKKQLELLVAEYSDRTAREKESFQQKLDETLGTLARKQKELDECKCRLEHLVEKNLRLYQNSREDSLKLKSKCSMLESELRALAEHNKHLTNETKTTADQLRDTQHQLKNTTNEKNALLADFNKMEDEIRSLADKSEENREMHKKLEEYARKVTELEGENNEFRKQQKIFKDQSTNLEILEKQNEILRDVVKSLRRERFAVEKQ